MTLREKLDAVYALDTLEYGNAGQVAAIVAELEARIKVLGESLRRADEMGWYCGDGKALRAADLSKPFGEEV